MDRYESMAKFGGWVRFVFESDDDPQLYRRFDADMDVEIDGREWKIVGVHERTLSLVHIDPDDDEVMFAEVGEVDPNDLRRLYSEASGFNREILLDVLIDI